MSGYCPDCGNTICMCREIKNEKEVWLNSGKATYTDDTKTRESVSVEEAFEIVVNLLKDSQARLAEANSKIESLGWQYEELMKRRKEIREAREFIEFTVKHSGTSADYNKLSRDFLSKYK